MRPARAAFKSIETRYRSFLSESILGGTYIMRSIPLKVSSSVTQPYLQELTTSLEEARREQARLQLEKDETQGENGELLQNYTRLQASVSELQTRVQEQEGKALHKAQLDSEIQGLRKALAGMLSYLCDTTKCFIIA